jgi:hypothetical protein
MSTLESPLLHDPGMLHDPFYSDTYLLGSIEQTVVPTVKLTVEPTKRKRIKKKASTKCKVHGCYEGINLRARNDAKYTLCESDMLSSGRYEYE